MPKQRLRVPGYPMRAVRRASSVFRLATETCAAGHSPETDAIDRAAESPIAPREWTSSRPPCGKGVSTWEQFLQQSAWLAVEAGRQARLLAPPTPCETTPLC